MDKKTGRRFLSLGLIITFKVNDYLPALMATAGLALCSLLSIPAALPEKAPFPPFLILPMSLVVKGKKSVKSGTAQKWRQTRQTPKNETNWNELGGFRESISENGGLRA